MTRKSGHFARFLVCSVLLSPGLVALAQQPSPQPGNPTASSPPPRFPGRNLQKGPPLSIDDAVAPFHVQGVAAHEALQSMSRKYNVVIGVEGVVYKSDPKISLDFAGGTLADLLNAFVAEARDYRWQNDDGIIHVFRNGASASLASVVLNFPRATGEDRYEIWRQLHTLPEYVAWMNSHQCHRLERIRPLDFRFDDGPIDIPAGQMTVAQLLDQVAKKSGDGFWAILQSDPSDPVCHVSVIDWSL